MRKAVDKGDYNFNSIFPARLRELLENTNTTQEEIANYCGIQRQSVAQWKDGKTKPDILSLCKIAQYFNVSADYLLGLSDVSTTDTNLKSVCEYTGLNEKSVNFFNECKDYWFEGRGLKEFIEFLIEEFETEGSQIYQNDLFSLVTDAIYIEDMEQIINQYKNNNLTNIIRTEHVAGGTLKFNWFDTVKNRETDLKSYKYELLQMLIDFVETFSTYVCLKHRNYTFDDYKKIKEEYQKVVNLYLSNPLLFEEGE